MLNLPFASLAAAATLVAVAGCSSGERPDEVGSAAPPTRVETSSTALDSVPGSDADTALEDRPTVTESATTSIESTVPTSDVIGASDASTAPAATDESGAGADSAVLESATVCWADQPAAGTGVEFTDATQSFGLLDPLTGMHGHAAAAGDVNDDGWTDLFVGSFADREPEVYAARGATGPSPDRVLLGGPDGFVIDESFPDVRGRSSGAVFADLDADGDDDLVVTRNQRGTSGIAGQPSAIYENIGEGWVERATVAPDIGARSVAAVELDGDGTLDLVIAGDRYGDGPTKVYQGDGAFGFDDVSAEWGVPDDLTGLALATVDLDGDGWLDVVVNGDRRVLLGGADGFTVADVPELTWVAFGEEDDPAGIAVGDLDGDDRPDLVLGQHFNSTVDFGERVPVRILLNRSEAGQPKMIDVTTESGSPALWTKAPHVALVDVDNDGLNDVVTSAATADGLPLVLRQSERVDGTPRFETIGDEGNGEYFVTGVTDDFDRDGRVDTLLLAWEPERASLFARNESSSGSWLQLDPSVIPGRTGREVTVIDSTTESVVARAWPEAQA